MKTQFKPGESGNIAGRPPGQTPGAKLRKAIELRADDILKSVIDATVSGDMQACKMLLDRITPTLKAQALPVKITLGDTLSETGGNVITATMSGQISPDIGAQLITALANQAKIVEIDDLLKRIELLESKNEH